MVNLLPRFLFPLVSLRTLDILDPILFINDLPNPSRLISNVGIRDDTYNIALKGKPDLIDQIELAGSLDLSAAQWSGVQVGWFPSTLYKNQASYNQP